MLRPLARSVVCLLGASDAIDPLQNLVDRSKYIRWCVSAGLNYISAILYICMHANAMCTLGLVLVVTLLIYISLDRASVMLINASCRHSYSPSLLRWNKAFSASARHGSEKGPAVPGRTKKVHHQQEASFATIICPPHITHKRNRQDKRS